MRRVLPDGAASTVEQILRASGAMPERHIDMMRSPSSQRLFEWAERLTGRGQLLWFGVRKRWMFESVEAAIRDGARQVLVLGAGMDPLAAMVAAQHPDVFCVEIDAPATADPKWEGLEGAGLVRANHFVCAVDLATTPLGDALQSTSWRKDAKSIVVAEGLLMYLEASDVDALFRALRENVGTDSRFAFTVMPADEQGRADLGPLSAVFRVSLRMVGEPLRWVLRPSDIPEFLGARGWRVLEQPSLDDLRQRFLVPIGATDEPLSQYDYPVLAEMTPAMP